jgi:hypothetical protein
MGDIIMRNWDLGQGYVQVNLPFPIESVRVPIWYGLSAIPGLPSQVSQVVPLISHIHLYPPHRSHLHPLSLSFSSTTLPSLQNTELGYLFLSLHVIIMS